MTHATKTLLLDGDVFCFKAALGAQFDIRYPDGTTVRCSEEGQAEAILEGMITKICKRLGTEEWIFFLTDPKDNWRNEVYPEYKAARINSDRPQLLTHLKEYAIKKFSAIRKDGFEADDLLGIWATGEYLDTSIIVSGDKDLRTIPGLFYDFNKINVKGYEVETISQESADRWHLLQSLAGDPVDGYPGCPGIGKQRAGDILDAGMKLVPEEGYITRGKNKGSRTVKWTGVPCKDPWQIVVTHYQKAGLTEDDALVQAQVARICRVDDYDEEHNAVILWEPDAPF